MYVCMYVCIEANTTFALDSHLCLHSSPHKLNSLILSLQFTVKRGKNGCI